MSLLVKHVGNFAHVDWRRFRSEQREGPADGSRGFIDGDLLELLLEMPAIAAEQVALGLIALDGAPVSAHEIIALVDSFARRH